MDSPNNFPDSGGVDGGRANNQIAVATGNSGTVALPAGANTNVFTLGPLAMPLMGQWLPLIFAVFSLTATGGVNTGLVPQLNGVQIGPPLALATGVNGMLTAFATLPPQAPRSTLSAASLQFQVNNLGANAATANFGCSALIALIRSDGSGGP